MVRKTKLGVSILICDICVPFSHYKLREKNNILHITIYRQVSDATVYDIDRLCVSLHLKEIQSTGLKIWSFQITDQSFIQLWFLHEQFSITP